MLCSMGFYISPHWSFLVVFDMEARDANFSVSIGLFRTRVDLRGLSKLDVGDMLVVSVGIDGRLQQCKNLLCPTIL